MHALVGKFIAFDGGEGCGKSTQIRRLADHVTATGVRTVCLRDPGSTRIGEQIRGVLLNPDHSDMGMRCEMLLYMAARAQLMHQVIAPALSDGMLVLCDRFVGSTLAYQAGGDGLSAGEIVDVARVALRDRWPDLTIILDMPVELSRSRVRAKFEHRTRTLFGVESVEMVQDRIEQRPLDYHRQVRERFLALARDDPEKFVVVDASADESAVEASVRRVIQERFGGTER